MLLLCLSRQRKFLEVGMKNSKSITTYLMVVTIPESQISTLLPTLALGSGRYVFQYNALSNTCYQCEENQCGHLWQGATL